MNYWLVKFAPFRYNWQDVLHNGKFEIYSVRNAQSRNNLKAMKLGDEVFFYHSQEGNEIKGVLKVSEEAHQDKTTEDTNWVSVTFVPIESFSKPISLQIIKGTKGLENIGLIKQPRLAVMKLTVAEFELINNVNRRNGE
jgi:predicted RNA-binding protein with PUA-like domain